MSTKKSVDQPWLRWLEDPIACPAVATTVGVPWPRGGVAGDQALCVLDEQNNPVASHSWPIAYWPDGSLKWSAHALIPSQQPRSKYRVALGSGGRLKESIAIVESPDSIQINTGPMVTTLSRSGADLIASVKRDRDILTHGRLVMSIDDRPSDDPSSTRKREPFVSQIKTCVVEQKSDFRVVVKFDGTHVGESGRSALPFSVRLYFHAGSDAIKLMHSFVYDVDEQKDFVSSIGLRFDVAMKGEMHDRHVRLVGQDHGLFAEGIRPITGLRRDPGQAARDAQINGRATPPHEDLGPAVANRLELIPAWGDFTLSQLCADGFTINKRTKPGHGWIFAGAGKRAAGVGYIGSDRGGVAFGLRDFWQKHPAQLDIRSAHTDAAEVTIWMYSPQAPAMDLRMYHDGLGMNTYPKQREGLEITYEDYEDGYGTPFGISRTSEIHLQVLPATPSRQEIVEFADVVRRPPQLVCPPQWYLDAKVFGAIWTIPDRSTPAKAALEDHLDAQLSLYLREIEQRSWYGFWDFGDVMHAYDTDRNIWRYDIGGFAWDNCELSTDLWIWYSFIRTGRADVFRMAEAMSRHTGEVDVYHLGRFKGLGTRHGVQHWSDSSKQSRISTSIYRRMHYFLTADERVGDLLQEQLHTIETEKKIVVGRKLGPNPQLLPLPPVQDPPPGGNVSLGAMGYCNAAAAWITHAERTNDKTMHERIIRSMQGIGDLPFGFLTSGWQVNIDTGVISYDGNRQITTAHLTALFGMPEMCVELIDTYGQAAPKFAWAYAIYGWMYSASSEERKREIGVDFKTGGQIDIHSRLLAYAARYRGDQALAQRAWQQCFGRLSPQERRDGFVLKHAQGPDVLNPIDAIPIWTNGAAQWSLAVIENLALIGDVMPEHFAPIEAPGRSRQPPPGD